MTNFVIIHNDLNKLNNFVFLEEGFWDHINYGVSTRAINAFFGSKKKFEDQIKKELGKNKKPEDIQREIEKRTDEYAAKYNLIELKAFVRSVLIEGILNGLINAVIHSIITLVKTQDIGQGILALFVGFVYGFIIHALLKILTLVYHQVKMRYYKDPYAKISLWEGILISLITIGIFIASVMTIAGTFTIGGFLLSFFVSVVLSVFISVALFIFPATRLLLNMLSSRAEKMSEMDVKNEIEKIKKQQK